MRTARSFRGVSGARAALQGLGLALALICALPAALAAQQSAQDPASASAQIRYRPAADAEQRKTLLLKDYQPRSMLHTASHPIARARFPVVDMHQHVNDAVEIGPRIPPAELIRRMDSLNIKTLVILTGAWGEPLQKIIDTMVTPYPGRFRVFTQIDWSRIDDPDFGARMVRQLDDGVRRGASGLKVLKDLGLAVRDKTGRLITVDDPRLDPIWEECGHLGIPVAIHSGDPEAFFQPIDGSNELYEALIENPTWSFYGPGFPSLESLLDARNRVFAKHPRTTFISLHMGWPENLDWVERMLRQYPNVYVEFGAREGELGRQPRRTRELLVKYQDRVLFGTDDDPEVSMYQNYFRWLQTSDEYFDHVGFPEGRRWTIAGLALPGPVLRKVYGGNADKIFRLRRGAQSQ